MLAAFSTERDTTRTIRILVAGGILAVAAAVVGISDNPLGIALAYLAATAFVLAFVHPWRRPGQFLWLTLASVIGFVVFAFLHNVAEVGAHELLSPGFFRDGATAVSVVSFLIAVLLCPPGLVIGMIGALATFIITRHR